MFLKTFRQKLFKKMTTPFMWRLKKFGHHPKNNDGRMAIENFQPPQGCANEKIQLAPFVMTKIFWLPSNTFTPLDVDQKISIAKEGKWGMEFFFPKNDNTCHTPFSCHLMMGICWMAIELFWSPKRRVHVISFLEKNHTHHAHVGD